MEAIKYISADEKGNVRIYHEILPFKITTEKCKSYFDLYLQYLVINDDILNRCCHIFNKILRYSDMCRCVSGRIIFIRNYDYCDNRLPMKRKFKMIFHKKLSIKCNKYWSTDVYKLKELLIDDNKYKTFCDHWNTSFDYQDLYDTINNIAKSYNVNLCDELIDMILIHAFKS
jgi:hypothetical protein